MRYFEYLVSYEDDYELDFEGFDEITPINSEQIMTNYRNQFNQWKLRNEKKDDDKFLDAWVINNWAYEITEKEYRKYFQ